MSLTQPLRGLDSSLKVQVMYGVFSGSPDIDRRFCCAGRTACRLQLGGAIGNFQDLLRHNQDFCSLQLGGAGANYRELSGSPGA